MLQVFVLERLICIQIRQNVIEQIVRFSCQRVLHIRKCVLGLLWIYAVYDLLVSGVELDGLELLLHLLWVLDWHHLSLM